MCAFCLCSISVEVLIVLQIKLISVMVCSTSYLSYSHSVAPILYSVVCTSTYEYDVDFLFKFLTFSASLEVTWKRAPNFSLTELSATSLKTFKVCFLNITFQILSVNHRIFYEFNFCITI